MRKHNEPKRRRKKEGGDAFETQGVSGAEGEGSLANKTKGLRMNGMSGLGEGEKGRPWAELKEKKKKLEVSILIRGDSAKGNGGDQIA